MQSKDEIYKVMTTIYNNITSSDANARATLLAVTLLVDIREQNQQIVELLKQIR